MTDRVGQQLDNYHLVRLLGAGSFGQVYLAEHVHRKMLVAVKILPPLADTDLPGFLNEARTIRLKHPHIVQVPDFGVSNHIPFIVMDYAPNGTLRQRYPKGTRLPLDTIISYVKQIAAALQYAHLEKLIHRDVKPENMLLGPNNEVLLSDFGIATVARSSRSQSTQEMAGTVAYMAPEQIRGKPVLASDQYALGVVVYEWLCGERPFNGSPMEIATQHMLALPPPLHEKIPGIPPAIEQVVLTALQKDPHQRFGSILAFANALEQVSKQSPPSTLPPAVPLPNQSLPPAEIVTSPSQLPQITGTSMQSPALATPSFSTVVSMPSGASYQPKRGISRRTVLVSLAGLAVTGGGIALLALSGRLHTQLGSAINPTSGTGTLTIANAGLRIPGVLQWGSDFVDGAPYVFKDPINPANLIGFEVEIMAAIGQLMLATPKQVETCYGEIDQALLANKFDFVMNSWEINPDRQKVELFSDPYYRYGQQLVVRADDPRFASLNATSDIGLGPVEGLTVGTGQGFKAADYLATDKKINVKLYAGPLPFDDLKQKKIDAVMVDVPIVAYYVQGAGPGGIADPALKLIGKAQFFDVYVVGLNKSNPNAPTVLSEINQAIAVLKKNGTLKQIYMKWSLWNDRQAVIGIV
jgi:serine/threonine protein kinase